ncbi:MAG: DUF2244 domain-containing protein [Rhodospirillales bacterium]|nr:DUF2244 domain-containing protein [Rhodospirillales bacterium]MDE2575467.1 DUF2244 domain-containing protein [Rhodospirillales bacterium]
MAPMLPRAPGLASRPALLCNAAMEQAAPVFEAVIVPHRSLSRRGRRGLVAAICLICGINAAIFVHLGAWPVGGFTGVELLLAAFLLELNARAVRESELVILSADGLRICRTDAKGRRQERMLPVGWLSVRLEEAPSRVPRLRLVAPGVTEEVGRALGEAEKRDLAAALDAALHQLRNPVFDNPQLRA